MTGRYDGIDSQVQVCSQNDDDDYWMDENDHLEMDMKKNNWIMILDSGRQRLIMIGKINSLYFGWETDPPLDIMDSPIQGKTKFPLRVVGSPIGEGFSMETI